MTRVAKLHATVKHERLRRSLETRGLTPWQKILRASELDEKLNLSRGDVRKLAADFDIAQRAEMDDEAAERFDERVEAQRSAFERMIEG